MLADKAGAQKVMDELNKSFGSAAMFAAKKDSVVEGTDTHGCGNLAQIKHIIISVCQIFGVIDAHE